MSLFGHLPDGRRVDRIVLGSDDGVRLGVLTLGATVHELSVPDGTGGRVNLALHAHDVAGYLATPSDYFGAVVGRYANRIAGASLPVEGTTYALAEGAGGHCLHGGPDGFHRRLWTVADSSAHHVRLVLVSPDGDQGFPGEVTAEVTYEVSGRDIRISFRATTTAPTVVSLTQHTHVNLAGSGTVEDHLLQVAAGQYLPVAEDLIPFDGPAPVTGTPLDLRAARRLGDVLAADHPQLQIGGGLDHCFVLDGSPAAVLSDPASGRSLTLTTDLPGLQVFSGNAFSDGREPLSGIALEPQLFPDAPHHAGETGWDPGVLRPGEVYTASITWTLR